ncbi:transaldolase [Helicobacter enhydrae]|uniref:Transaldolase n=1 Tax=Helicobacter enhydrae TaxID=222136 RepID=A0A1B1U7G3_9HELI|nr:transaldolase [Helicobacter enhydrae]ANV98671.1 transaldolase [Helicobacter enhydrae]
MHIQLKNQNFSLWCDFIERDFLQTDFKTLIKEGKIYGATSNPSIFANALKTSQAYKAQIASLQHKSAKEIYETIALEDIKTAAQILRPLWDQDKNDGYISIEIDPLFCDDAQESIKEGKRLFATLNEPNVMIKVPATNAGYETMEELLKCDIPINATLVFAPLQAQKCLQAFKHARDGGSQAKSVISVFVSRLDRALDSQLPPALTHQLGIQNAKNIYQQIQDFGDCHTRTLFASTGVKGGGLKPSYYIDELLLPNSINTAPLETIQAYCSNPDTQIKTSSNTMDQFGSYDLQSLYERLLQEGLEAFKTSFKELLSSLKSQ